ncbi:Nuclear control of ATPase protein 2 [Mortierella hygrophila]|uniref:Nuclear control of ATPase protein 2 n=1 Tax=Mortierella hygrophila TaxID=979708 RepID=A0A9P6K5Y3_9FUNG|nr:Nuclear control of ATPase protein 2 [Mortierella hygrophila]
MATFITDKVLHINNDLVQLFHLDTQALIEDQHPHANNSTTSTLKTTPRPSSSKKDTSVNPTEQADHALLTGLRDAVELLDLRSGAVPPMERALLAIQKVEALAKSTGSGSKEGGGDEAANLEHLFLAKATATVYLNLLDIILNATLPLANEMEYWQSLLDSSSWRILYILQTSPYRLFSLTRSVALTTKEHIDSLIATSQESEGANHILQLIKYFPTFLNNHLISQPVSFPLAIHYEISHHRKQLQRIREYQAECLGLLAEQGLNLDPEHLEDSITPSESSSSIMSASGASNDIAQAQAFVQEQISKTVCLMERVLDKASKDTRHLTNSQQQKVSSKKVTRSLTMLGNLQGISNLNNVEMLAHLENLITVQIPRYVEETEGQARQFQRPSWLTRIWIPALIGYFGLKYGIQYISEHRADLDDMLEEAWDTAKRFVTDWVWEPSVRVMNIIRHSDDQGSLQMLGNESLQSDIASLERMVLAFGKDNYNMGLEELEALSKAVHNGDISVIMRAYENELKTPLKGAVAGHLVQTLLIQIQKTKVDVEVAMAALDKLLKANELNFAFLAVGPSLLLLWAVSAQAKSSWQRFAGKNLGIVSIQMRNSLRQVERLLNLASTDGDSHAKATERPKAVKKISQDSEYDDFLSTTSSPAMTPSSDMTTEPLTNSLSVLPSTMTSEKLDRIRAKNGKVPYKTQGLILCEVHLLRTFAARLTRNEGLRDKVLEDLREIEESSLTVHQRLRTTKRMYRTYGFLGLNN